MDTVGSDAITRRSLIAAGGVVATNLIRPRPALARLLARGPTASLAQLPLVSLGLQAGPGQPPIVARRAWAQGGAPPKVAPEYGTVKLAFVHHTENPDGYGAAAVPGMLRSIYDFHRFTHGWNDIGYNFVIDRFGRIFEARAGGIDEPVIGAHAGGYNAYSTGIAILGSYSSQVISPPARAALEQLLAWKLSLHGAPVEGHVTVRVTSGGAVYSRYPAHTPVSLPRVAGHRDGDSTDCPGDALYGELQAVRQSTVRLAPAPARATIQLQSGEAGAPATLSGTLRLLSGAPIANAPVAIQLRTVAHRGERVAERTIAQALTDPEGQWELAVAISPAQVGKTVLRALSTGAGGVPVTVSDPLVVAGTVSFTVPPTPGEASAPSPPSSPPPGS
ncbi:MAG TPA: N-acetylmuramoyl-L-alanine amidase [Solirubrobacteraceae bacterium]|jgi:uncharacterized protein with LGFP repeats|nr:N-acetylmuramoyl-L-alanine amidase [Solirubrobacteraceae bacterium]